MPESRRRRRRCRGFLLSRVGLGFVVVFAFVGTSETSTTTVPVVDSFDPFPHDDVVTGIVLPEAGDAFCGTEDLSAEERQRVAAAVSAHKIVQEQRRPLSSSSSSSDSIYVNVYWHVLTVDDDPSLSYPDSVVRESLDVLNDAFSGVLPRGRYPACPSSSSDASPLFEYRNDVPASPFVFALRGIVRHDGAGDVDTYGSALYREDVRVGDCGDLNVYTGRSRYGGFSTFPHHCPVGGHPQYPRRRDSVVVNVATLPGASSSSSSSFFGLDQGDTVVHEVGHWLGLYHTFGDRDGGDNDGDGCAHDDDVEDTPAQRDASRACPIGRDSCPLDDGVDPVHNYMDYSSDCCKYRLTAGQIERMVLQADLWRGLLPSGPPTDPPSATPSNSAKPSHEFSSKPTTPPSLVRSTTPTTTPSIAPTMLPTSAPSIAPTTSPSIAPSTPPTLSTSPSTNPTTSPAPSVSPWPSHAPSTAAPTVRHTLDELLTELYDATTSVVDVLFLLADYFFEKGEDGEESRFDQLLGVLRDFIVGLATDLTAAVVQAFLDLLEQTMDVLLEFSYDDNGTTKGETFFN